MVNTKKGFTIIEIMFVLAVIGVLAAGAFGGLQYLRRAKMSNTRRKLATLDGMLEQYKSDIREYPTDLQELIDGPTKPQLQKRGWGEAIASEDELVDAWDQPFVYTVNPKGTRPPYELYSIGSKGDAQILSPRSQE